MEVENHKSICGLNANFLKIRTDSFNSFFASGLNNTIMNNQKTQSKKVYRLGLFSTRVKEMGFAFFNSSGKVPLRVSSFKSIWKTSFYIIDKVARVPSVSGKSLQRIRTLNYSSVSSKQRKCCTVIPVVNAKTWDIILLVWKNASW